MAVKDLISKIDLITKDLLDSLYQIAVQGLFKTVT